MSLLSGIYDSEPIQPIAKIKENLSVWSSGVWSHYRILNIEPMPLGSPMVVEMVVASGATTIPGYGTIAQRIVAILQLAEREFLHVRWEPIDDVEGILWEQASVGKFVTRGTHSRVTRFTSARDPWLATTTFWILGMNKDMQLEVRNPNPGALPQARFAFFGYRYKLEELSEVEGKEIETGRKPTTYVPAEGFK